MTIVQNKLILRERVYIIFAILEQVNIVIQSSLSAGGKNKIINWGKPY